MEAHTDEVFSLDFNPHDEHIFLTGSKDSKISLWDIRKPEFKLYTFESHGDAVSLPDQVIKLEWCPYDVNYFSSCSEDNKVNISNVAKIGDETREGEGGDGPQELLFSHRGHKELLKDASWNLTKESMLLASVDNCLNHLEVWQMVAAGDPGEQPHGRRKRALASLQSLR